jgi:hypothetical protein
MEWKIDRIRDRCSACSQPFQHDQRLLSVVEFDGERPVRRDLCAACGPKPGSRALWWEARFELQSPKKKRVDFDRLLRIFEAWQAKSSSEAPGDGGDDALLYLITLLLVRKRYLRMVDLVSEGGRDFLRLRRPGPAERSYLAPAPLLQPADLPALRQRLEDLIDGSIEEEEMPATTDASGAASA